MASIFLYASHNLYCLVPDDDWKAQQHVSMLTKPPGEVKWSLFMALVSMDFYVLHLFKDCSYHNILTRSH